MKASKCPHNIICGNDAGGWWCGQCNANISRYYVNKVCARDEAEKAAKEETMSDSTRVTGQPAPPTPQDWMQNVLEVLRGFKGASFVLRPKREKEQAAAEERELDKAIGQVELAISLRAQPLTPPQPPPARWHVGQELFCVEGCGDVRVTKVVYHEDVQTWFYYTSDPNDIDGHLEENLRLKITHKAAPPSLTAPPMQVVPQQLPGTTHASQLVTFNTPAAASLTAEELLQMFREKHGIPSPQQRAAIELLVELPGIKVVRG